VLWRLSLAGWTMAIGATALTASPAADQCSGISASVQPRLTIPVFRYAGSEDGEARNHFSRFQAVLSVKLATLIGEVQQADSGKSEVDPAAGRSALRLDYLRDLGLYVPKDGPITDTLNTLAKRETYWRVQNALQLLRGELWPGQPYFVDSSIFIGDLRGSFPSPEVHIRMPVQPELVPSTNDSHSLVTYYALAMDARRLRCDPAIVRSLLSRAWSVLQDLKRRRGDLVGDVAKLEPLVKHELQSSP
jgi:hypothetical protein